VLLRSYEKGVSYKNSFLLKKSIGEMHLHGKGKAPQHMQIHNSKSSKIGDILVLIASFIATT